jgi:beta-lactamase class A
VAQSYTVMRRRSVVLVFAVLALAAVGIGGWLVRPTPAALSWPALRNATYPTSLQQRLVTLHDGLFEAPAAPGSASLLLVRLVDLAAFGDLDADDRPDAAVVLVTSGGGSGVFIDLVAVRNDQGIARPVARVQLGDRVLVRELRIEDRAVVVRMRARDAADPFTRLTHEITRRYLLEGTTLTLHDEVTADVPINSPIDFVYQPQRLDLPTGGSRTVSGSLAPGQIATYLLHAEAGQPLELQARSLFNNAVVSVSGLSDGQTYLSRNDYAVDSTVVVPAAQDYAIRVITLAGQNLPFTLSVRLGAIQAAPSPTATPTAQPVPSARPAASSPATSFAGRPLDELSAAASAFGRARPPVWGAAVVVPTSGVAYFENADEQVPAASVVKVLIMLTLLEEARADKRPVSEGELALLWPMITESDNDSASQLWEDVGRGQAVASYLRSIGIVGFTPDPQTSWGVCLVSARAMALALSGLLDGRILDEPSRALAIKLLDSVTAARRWGVSSGTDARDAVGLKDGWYPGDEGWRVNSAGIVRPTDAAPYAIAIVTDGRASWNEGIDTIEGIASRLNAALPK